MKRYLTTHLTEAVRFSRAREPHRGIARLRLLTLLGALSVITAISMQQAKAINNSSVEMFKLYAHMKVLNDKQYRCLVILWRKESNWSPTARSKTSSAFGIPQLLKMTETNPFKQIDLGIKYIEHRYKGDMCQALLAHNIKGHY